MGDNVTPKQPKLVKRRDHNNSSFRAGRTIGEKREKLETANERFAARKKDKARRAARIIATIIGFICLTIILVMLLFNFAKKQVVTPESTKEDISFDPTIEIIDEAANSSDKITTRMREFIGRVEHKLKSLNITPTRVVIPSESIRQVNFYLEGHNGYIKMLIDRGAGVSAEDTSRMLKYLAETGVNDFEYIDVRIEGKAYWK